MRSVWKSKKQLGWVPMQILPAQDCAGQPKKSAGQPKKSAILRNVANVSLCRIDASPYCPLQQLLPPPSHTSCARQRWRRRELKLFQVQRCAPMPGSAGWATISTNLPKLVFGCLCGGNNRFCIELHVHYSCERSHFGQKANMHLFGTGPSKQWSCTSLVEGQQHLASRTQPMEPVPAPPAKASGLD